MLLYTPYEIAVDLAKRFRLLRNEKKITLKELSTRSGVPYSTIRRFESEGEISLLSFIKIVSAIGEDREIMDLLSETKPQSIEEIIYANRR